MQAQRKKHTWQGYYYAGILWLALVLLASSSWAQVSQPCFSANVTRGCAPLTITLTDCSNGGNIITYNYGVGQERTSTTTFTYTTPGKYTVTQFGNFGPVNNTSKDSLIKVDYIEVLDSPPPVFTVTTCKDRGIVVDITDTVYDEFEVNFGDGSPTQRTTPGGSVAHTYANTSVQAITVTGIYNVANPCGGSNTRSVTPITDLIRPEITGLNITGASAMDIHFNVSEFLRYQILQRTGATGNFREIHTISNPLTGAYTHTITANSSIAYTYRVMAFDACNNRLYSDDISSLPVTATAENDQMVLTWPNTTPNAFTRFSIYRNNQLLTQISGNQLRYVDQSVQCPNDYCYQIIGETAAGTQSTSNTSCARAISTSSPPAVENITATLVNGIPDLKWTVPTGIRAQEYTILRSENGEAFREIARTTNTGYQDNRANIRQSRYCYRVQYTDACNNVSLESLEACPMILSQNATSGNGVLNWNPYREWPGGVQEYVLEKLDEQGNTYEAIPIPAGEFAYTLPEEPDLRQQVLRFRVQAVSGGNPTLSSYSNIVEFVQPMTVLIPDAFTPNGDNLNDRFEVRVLFVQTFRMVIYNRWGEVIFTSTDVDNSWDGMLNGQQAPVGTYTYTLEASDSTGRKITRQGKITLIK